jgi:hypothetical protein
MLLAFNKSGLFCQNRDSPAVATTAAHGSRRLPRLGLFCRNPRKPAVAATAHHGSRRRRATAGASSESKALIADLRRDSARRS